ncbi:Erf4 domain containing protein [Asbolus verrucosus]|uniref:Erf4 domain containing protein n=1 Tax=Asbolus verrucosus TaxID=1661398 RepID=A0A482VKD9_ASBVE|nr:Erf4 domain containing protein [Asbolus verrucosus]
MPSRLITKVAPEEYEVTLHLINKVLRKNLINNLTWFLCGCVPLCCTLGCSMCPAVYFNKRTIRTLHKILRAENRRFYNKLGLHWSLHKQHFEPLNLVEYVLIINFLQRPEIYVPD